VWVSTPDGSRSPLSGNAVFDALSDRQLLTLLEYAPPAIAPEPAPESAPPPSAPGSDVVTDQPPSTAPTPPPPTPGQTTLGEPSNAPVLPDQGQSDPMATRTNPTVPGGGF